MFKGNKTYKCCVYRKWDWSNQDGDCPQIKLRPLDLIQLIGRVLILQDKTNILLKYHLMYTYQTHLHKYNINNNIYKSHSKTELRETI